MASSREFSPKIWYLEINPALKVKMETALTFMTDIFVSIVWLRVRCYYLLKSVSLEIMCFSCLEILWGGGGGEGGVLIEYVKRLYIFEN